MRQTRTYRMSKAQAMVTGTPKGGLHQCLLERALHIQRSPAAQLPLPRGSCKDSESSCCIKLRGPAGRMKCRAEDAPAESMPSAI